MTLLFLFLDLTTSSDSLNGIPKVSSEFMHKVLILVQHQIVSFNEW